MQTIAPEAAGLSPARLARIDALMQRHVDSGTVAGLAVAIVRRSGLAYSRHFGLADREAARPIQPDTIYRIYSMTKPITAVAALMLYEEGRFQLDDPVSAYIPAFAGMRVYAGEAADGPVTVPAEREVTIWHLLTHTAGLVYPDPQGLPVERRLAQDDRATEASIPEETLAEWVPRLARHPLAFQPGSRWYYSLAFDVLGYLVQVVSGMPYDAYLKARIFEPLGMVDTGFWVPPERAGRLAALYTAGAGGALERVDPPAARDYTRPARFFGGGGGLVSTVDDYLRFAEMLRSGGELAGERLLGRKTVELLATNQLPGAVPFDDPPRPGLGFGLGVQVRTDVGLGRTLGSVGDYGWAGHANTDFWVDPQEQLIGLIMPQLVPYHGPGRRLSETFRVLTYQALE